MSDFNITDYANNYANERDEALATVATLREKIAELEIERDEARVKRDRYAAELLSLKQSIQGDLAEFANSYLQSGDEDYKELSELMVNNGLEGLKRTFTVTVRVSYDFEVEVEATDEDEARDEVDNNITTYAQDYVYLSDTPDDMDIEATEA